MTEERERFVLNPKHPEYGLGIVKNKLIVQDPEKGKQVYVTVEWLSKPDSYKDKVTVIPIEEISYL